LKTFRSVAVLPFEPAIVSRTIRDELQKLVPRLSDISSITTEKRKRNADGSIVLLNRWKTTMRVPPAIASRNGESIAWLDRARWTPDGQCAWEIEPTLFSERITCRGETRFEPAMGGRGTRIAFEGTIDLRLGGIVAPGTEAAIKAVVEFLAMGVIPRNFQRLARAVHEHLRRD
jgi:hypothetical protein